MFEIKAFHDEIDILRYQSGADKINKAIKNIIYLIIFILCFDQKNDQTH